MPKTRQDRTNTFSGSPSNDAGEEPTTHAEAEGDQVPIQSAHSCHCCSRHSEYTPIIAQEDLPTFSGDPLEDPKIFIQELETLFKEHQVKQNLYLKYTKKTLSNSAKQWFEDREDLKWNFNVFAEDFIKSFNNPKIIAAITGTYFGKRQQQAEPVAKFLKMKQQQADRIGRDTTQDIATIIALMHPEMGLHLQPHPIDLRSLRNEAIELEKSLSRIHKPTNHMPNIRPQSSTNKYLPKCRMCPGFHWHKTVPRVRKTPKQTRLSEVQRVCYFYTF